MTNVVLYTYNDGRQPGGRRPRLWLAKNGDGVAKKFNGNDIPGFAIVASQEFRPNGKWSNTTYRLMISPGVTPVYMISPLHGIWGQDFLSWCEAAAQLGISEALARQIVASEYPDTAARLDKIEAEFARLAETSPEPEVVFIHFGSPTNRQIEDGFWETPKEGETTDGRLVRIVRDDSEGWHKPRAVEPEGAVVVGVKKTPGHHGGWYEVQVVVPPGVN